MASKLDLPRDGDTASSSKKPQAEGFFHKIVSMFMGMGSADAEKKRVLRQLSKNLTHAGYRFYKPKTLETQVPLAKFFYEVYKAIAPAQVSLNNASTSGVLKAFVIESFLTKEQRELADHLTDTYINEKANSMAVKDLQEMIKGDMINFFSAFDVEKSLQIDTAYNTILSFINFINFDFFFLLKKFDSNIAERSFTYNPKFEAISSDYVSEDIADFLEVLLGLNLDADWKRIFEALKQYRNMEVIQIDTWLKLVPAIKDVRTSGILENIVRYDKQDPYLSFSPRISGERIVEPFIEKLKNQTTMLVQKISQERRSSKIDELANAVFGTTIVLRLKNYTEKANMPYAKKMLGGFTQTAAMNFLKAYLIDYFKKDIRELVDLLIIRGQWSTSVQSQQLSDGYHALLEVSEQIIKFDDELADDGDMGARLRSAVMKTDRDKEQLKYVRQLLKDVNEKALGLVNKSATNLIGIGRHLRGMIDDLAKPHHEMILNWKEIESAANKPMKEFITETYKKIYYMVQLLQYYVKENHE